MTDLDREIAGIMEVEVDLLPYLPELLDGWDALGSWPETILDFLRPLDLPPSTRVLDLGCGKGAVSVAIARELGWRVTGVDAFEPFIEAARSAASENGLDDLCAFRVGDLRDWLSPSEPYDVLVWASLGPMLGGVRETTAKLAAAVKPGGWIVIDDCVLGEEMDEPPPGYENHLTLERTRAGMEAAGAMIASELIVPDERVRTCNRLVNDTIWPRARALKERRPELASLVDRYLEREMTECEFLEDRTRAVVWLLRKLPAD